MSDAMPGDARERPETGPMAKPLRILALANQKGGVGKTSVTLGLADVLATRGQRVLVVDIDPQANATAGLGLEDEA